jgi:hypothetical protein
MKARKKRNFPTKEILFSVSTDELEALDSER